MRHRSAKSLRALAIDTRSYGFGFAVMEQPPMRLIDYGVKKVKGEKNSACRKKVADLISHYRPDVIVLRDSTSNDFRRSLRVQEMTQEILKLALSERIRTRSISRVQITKAFPSSDVSTKHQVASSIIMRFPELAFRLPPPRRPWMSEYERMSMFEAVALALALFLRKSNCNRDS